MLPIRTEPLGCWNHPHPPPGGLRVLPTPPTPCGYPRTHVFSQRQTAWTTLSHSHCMPKRSPAGTKKPEPETAASTAVAPVVAPWPALLRPSFDDDTFASPEQICSDMQISLHTLQNWVKRGLPQAVRGARPKYRMADVFTWSAYYRYHTALFQKGRTAPPEWIDIEEAWNWRLLREHEAMPGLGDGNAYVVVPLSLSHPQRAAQLQRACAGIDDLHTLAALS